MASNQRSYNQQAKDHREQKLSVFFVKPETVDIRDNYSEPKDSNAPADAKKVLIKCTGSGENVEISEDYIENLKFQYEKLFDLENSFQPVHVSFMESDAKIFSVKSWWRKKIQYLSNAVGFSTFHKEKEEKDKERKFIEKEQKKEFLMRQNLKQRIKKIEYRKQFLSKICEESDDDDDDLNRSSNLTENDRPTDANTCTPEEPIREVNTPTPNEHEYVTCLNTPTSEKSELSEGKTTPTPAQNDRKTDFTEAELIKAFDRNLKKMSASVKQMEIDNYGSCEVVMEVPEDANILDRGK